VRPTLHGVDGHSVSGVWITGIRRRIRSTTQGHKPRSDTLRSTGVEGREAGKQGHKATLGDFPAHLDGRTPQLWTTGAGGDKSGLSAPAPRLVSRVCASLDSCPEFG